MRGRELGRTAALAAGVLAVLALVGWLAIGGGRPSATPGHRAADLSAQASARTSAGHRRRHHDASPADCAPSAKTTMTNAVSHLCGFADTTNTGVPAGTHLWRVPQDITRPRADGSTGRGWTYDRRGFIRADCPPCRVVIKNVKAADIYIDGNRATVEDSVLREVAIQNADNVTVKDDTIHGLGERTRRACEVAVQDTSTTGDDQNVTIENNDIYWCGTGINGFTEGGLIANNYMHDFGFAEPDNHLNGIQLEAGSGDRPMVIRDNTILNNARETDAIMLAADSGGVERNRTITHNLLAGGDYCFYGAGGPDRTTSDITFTENRFSRTLFRRCGSLGPVAYWVSRRTNTWSGNRWDRTGAPVHR